MVIRFFLLQSHYSSTNDLTDEGLLAAEKGYKRIIEAAKTLADLSTENKGSDLDSEIIAPLDQFMTDMCDDFNTPKAMASLFDLVTKINSLKEGHLDLHQVSSDTLDRLKKDYPTYLEDVLGLKIEAASGADNGALDHAMALILDLRQNARTEKNWAVADKIRDALAAAEITVKDGKEGSTWSVN